MNKPDLLEDLLALQYVYGDITKQNQSEYKPECPVCRLSMDYDKLNRKWACLRCNL